MRVPDRYRLGEAGQGAAVMGAALSLEHGGGNYFSGQARLLRNLAQWAVAPGRDGMRPVDDGLVRMGLARIRARYEIAQAFVGMSFADATLFDSSPRRFRACVGVEHVIDHHGAGVDAFGHRLGPIAIP